MEEKDDEFINIRKDKVVKFFKNSQKWVVVLLIIALIFGGYIRSLPMTDHGGRPGLWDITRNTWTLGPDLDPWLFLRNAKTIVEDGRLPEIDMMRNVPLGFDNSKESQLLPYMIVYTHKFFNIFSDVNIEFSGAAFPVVMFILTIISFFLFVREVFIRKSKEGIFKANVIALIASFFMIVVPVFLSRTVAGIPEKESAAFFFMFLALYLFLKAWKSDGLKMAMLFGVLAGISTAFMGLIWGGVIYLFIPIGLASLIAFILNRVGKKEFIVYTLWVVISFGIMDLLSSKYSLFGLVTSLSSGMVTLTLFVMIIHQLVFKSKFIKKDLFRKTRIPETIWSVIISLVVLTVLSVIILGPSFIIEKLQAIHQTIFKPVLGRWNITVAENRQPNFQEWSGNFGPFFKGIPLMFWLFFIGSVVLFKKMLIKVRRKDSWILAFLYVFFFLGLVFSRYSGDSVFSGDNFISKAFYYLSSILFIAGLIYFYAKYDREGYDGFKKIRYEFLLLFSLFVLTVFTARGAVRLIMVLGPIAPIMVSYLIVEGSDRFLKAKDKTWKMLLGVCMIIILIASMYTFFIYYKSVKAQAYSFVPSAYNLQWQRGMEWVRENTEENAVFNHWWDYGYWVQSIGERATSVDGGNAITYWNYLMGRHVLTGDNQDDALEFLYNHNTTHFLIDSSDVGKYTAFSSIGSDENYDRYSWMATFLMDEKQTQETKDQTLLVYSGGIGVDEDIVVDEDGEDILIPSNGGIVGAIVLPVVGDNSYHQPYAIMLYQGKQYNVNMRYLYLDGRLVDYKSGIEGVAFVYPRIEHQNGGIGLNPVGAAIYVSPRLFRGMLSQVYLMDDPLNNFPGFELVHNEPSLVVGDLRSQGMQLPDFVYFNGLQGPIKIWEMEYTGKEKYREEYVDTDADKYLSWKL
ncbi:hypothetical protein CMI42_01870 [Candidatus Pacearchaeota archaeon]|nr:hypothetical protein [Candidatus Pacearchaeota archaeon]